MLGSCTKCGKPLEKSPAILPGHWVHRCLGCKVVFVERFPRPISDGPHVAAQVRAAIDWAEEESKRLDALLRSDDHDPRWQRF
jgi:hypothetical protein